MDGTYKTVLLFAAPIVLVLVILCMWFYFGSPMEIVAPSTIAVAVAAKAALDERQRRSQEIRDAVVASEVESKTVVRPEVITTQVQHDVSVATDAQLQEEAERLFGKRRRS